MQATALLFQLVITKKNKSKNMSNSITNSNEEQQSVCSGDLAGLSLFRVLSYD